MADRLIKIVEDYFADLHNLRRLGAGTDERSYYPAVARMLDAIGADLKGRVLCLPDLENIGAGHPDFGLFTSSQLQRGVPRKGQMPERGVIEMKPVADAILLMGPALDTNYAASRLPLWNGRLPEFRAAECYSQKLSPAGYPAAQAIGNHTQCARGAHGRR